MAENIVVPLAPPAEAPKPNMFANWGQNGKGNWAKLDAESKKADAEFFDKKREAMGIADPNAPKQEIVTPYNPDVKVVPQQQVRNPQTRSTGNPQNQPIRSTDDLARAMGYTSPEDEDRMRKASLTNQRILAIGDAIRQIGNIYHTVNYAPSQQFNNPVEAERQRYLQGKALRDRANQTYINYMQQKAAQDAKQKQWEADYSLKVADAARKAGYTEAQIKNMQDRLANQKAYQDANIALGKRKADDAKALGEARLKETTAYHNKMAGIAGMNAKTNRDKATAYINKLKSGGNASSMPLQTPNGSIYAPGKSVPQPQMNQLYKYAISNGYINQSDFQKKMAEAGFGKADPDYVRNQMVAEAMMEHGELADFARDNYGWTYGQGGGGMDLGLEDDDDDAMNLELE